MHRLMCFIVLSKMGLIMEDIKSKFEIWNESLVNHANLRCGIMPSFSGISQNQDIQFIKVALNESRIERVTFFIFSLIVSEHLLSPYYVSGTMQYRIKCNKYIK